jgi:hypothetical protein
MLLVLIFFTPEWDPGTTNRLTAPSFLVVEGRLNEAKIAEDLIKTDFTLLMRYLCDYGSLTYIFSRFSNDMYSLVRTEIYC